MNGSRGFPEGCCRRPLWRGKVISSFFCSKYGMNRGGQADDQHRRRACVRVIFPRQQTSMTVDQDRLGEEASSGFLTNRRRFEGSKAQTRTQRLSMSVDSRGAFIVKTRGVEVISASSSCHVGLWISDSDASQGLHRARFSVDAKRSPLLPSQEHYSPFAQPGEAETTEMVD